MLFTLFCEFMIELSCFMSFISIFQVVKLDLNYLYEVAPFPNGVLRVSLRFDLIRSDHRRRLYLFEDIDSHIKVF